MSAADRAFVVLTLLAAASCGDRTPAPVVVRDPSYVVVRPIRREPDAEHTIQVDLPMAGGGYGFASAAPLLDMSSFDLARAEFAGGRTSTVGSATIWLPVTAEGNRRLQEWFSRSRGEMLGVYVKHRLVAAPTVNGVGGGIFIPVPNKADGSVLLKELRNGGSPS
jgi:hypothetical protein